MNCKTLSTIEKAILVMALVLSFTVISVGCKGKRSVAQGDEPCVPVSQISHNATDTLPDDVSEEIFGKASITGKKYLDVLSSIHFQQNASLAEIYGDVDLCALEDKFADDIFLDFEDGVVSDPFALAVKELYDRSAAVSYSVSLCEIRDAYEYYYCDSTSKSEHPSPFSDTVRPSENKLAQVFGDSKIGEFFSDFFRLIRRDGNYEIVTDYFADFENYSYAYEFPFDTLRLKKAYKKHSKYYDKSSFVPDIKYFQNYYASDDSTALTYDDPVGVIERRLRPDMSFDEKCVYAIELSHLMRDEGIDVLGALIESREYSRYLLEVWENWRVNVQSLYFGLSNSSVIPNAYYSKIHGICANTMLRHIQSHPDDDYALSCLSSLVCDDHCIHRGWIYGNYAIPIWYNLRQNGI